jgi:hypothetical protein
MTLLSAHIETGGMRLLSSRRVEIGADVRSRGQEGRDSGTVGAGARFDKQCPRGPGCPTRAARGERATQVAEPHAPD